MQGNFGIVYEKQNGGLLRPTIIEDYDEFDFLEFASGKYALYSGGTTQNLSLKFLTPGDTRFREGDFAGAIKCYDKALERAKGQIRARLFYNKALALVNAGRMTEVIPTLQQAITLDPTFHQPASAVVQEVLRQQAAKSRR